MGCRLGEGGLDLRDNGQCDFFRRFRADIKAGRFETTSAIYSRADQLAPSEIARKTPVRCLECGWLGVGWHLKAEACPVCDGRVEELIEP